MEDHEGELVERLVVARKTAQGLIAKAKAAASSFSFSEPKKNNLEVQGAEAREDAAGKEAEASEEPACNLAEAFEEAVCKGAEASKEPACKGAEAGEDATVKGAEAGEEAATGAEASKEATAKGARASKEAASKGADVCEEQGAEACGAQAATAGMGGETPEAGEFKAGSWIRICHEEATLERFGDSAAETAVPAISMRVLREDSPTVLGSCI